MPSNAAIADLFDLLSKLMEIHQENSFKAKSYATASFNIEKLPVEIDSIPKEQIAAIKGIGESTAKKIIELLDTGKIGALEELMQKTPEGILEMMQIKGLGPKKIATIWKEMGIENIGELLYACNENRLLLYKGFGEKTQKNVAEAIEFFMRHQGHFLYAEIETYAERLTEILLSNFKENAFEITGEFKRQMPTIEKLSWVTDADNARLVDFFSKNGFEVTGSNTSWITAVGQEKVPLEFHISLTSSLTSTLFRLNCSEYFYSTWIKKFPGSTDGKQDEASIFKSVNINFIPACMREKDDVIDVAKTEGFHDIIRTEDIKGIIHSHSNWSDGTDSIDDMAQACISKGLEYLVISDHSKSAFYANGLSEERVREQHRHIDELNKKLFPFKIFKSIESDILNDGSLDYSDNLMGTFDLVIASVHSNLKMSEEKAMQRIITAIENRHTTILGHPTGRLLLSRKGYPIDHEKVIDACIANKVAIEINAHPRRLDLDWNWIGKAQDKGAILSINPDAHTVEGYDDTRYGILAAQKGGLKKQCNLSSKTREDFEKYLKEVKR